MSLAVQLVTREGAQPTRYALLLHGLLGRGSNWQGFARKLVSQRPDWGALLADLRLHGDSQLPPPHTWAATTGDVCELLSTVHARSPVHALIGHSFGGKVALGVLSEFAARAERTGKPHSLEQVWVLDASPSAREKRNHNEGTQSVLHALRALPARVASRADFVAKLQQLGVSSPLAHWLAKNLERDGEMLHFALDLDGIETLLAAHDRADLWPVLQAPPARLKTERRIVLGGRSTTVSRQERARLAALQADGCVQVDELAQAGHWLHVDDPEGLLTLLSKGLPRSES